MEDQKAQLGERNAVIVAQQLDLWRAELQAQHEVVTTLQGAVSGLTARVVELERTILLMRAAAAGHGASVL